MRMKKLEPRGKKPVRGKSSRGTKLAIVGVGVALAVSGAVAASMLASPAPASSAASPQRIAENRKAQAELAAPAADYGAASSTPAGKTAAAAKASPVTITGCLEPHEDGFRLKDAAGDAAPKARSWKSGFLKKSTPAVDVVDATNRLKLKDHVGQRVSVSGVLVDREMRARTLQRVAATCS